MDTLFAPEVFPLNAVLPTATFSEPSVFAVNASYPIATLLSPVVIASNAVKPKAVFFSAVLVVDEGSLPIYTELTSIKASVKSSIELAPPADPHSKTLPDAGTFNTWPEDPIDAGTVKAPPIDSVPPTLVFPLE